MLDDGGIDLAGVYTESFGSRLGVPTADNELVAAFVERHPDARRRVRRDRPVGGRLGPRRGRGRRARAVRCGAVAVQAAADAGRPADGAGLRAVRGAAACRSCCTPASTGRWTRPTTSGTRGTSTPSPRAFPDLRIVALHAALAVGRGHDDGGLAAPERVRGPVRAPAAHVRPRRARAGSRCCATGTGSSPTGSCSPPRGRCSGSRPRDLAAEVRELPLDDAVLEQVAGRQRAPPAGGGGRCSSRTSSGTTPARRGGRRRARRRGRGVHLRRAAGPGRETAGAPRRARCRAG